MISRDIKRVIISGATSSIGIALCEECVCSGIGGKTYVIGYGKSKLLREYLEEVRDILCPAQDMGFGERPYNADAVMHLECDISELTADTGFVPSVDFEEGIRRLANTYIVGMQRNI